MKLFQALPELIDAGIISEETAQRIRDHYAGDSSKSGSRLILIFGILGALLVGLGIILIIGHNWDHLSRLTQTIIAFVPMVVGQAIGIYTLTKRSGDSSWREGSATFLALAIGATMAMISQIYQAQGQLDGFLFVWILLVLPIPYLFRSSFACFLYFIGILYFVGTTTSHSASFEGWLYWPLFLGGLPYYIKMFLRDKGSNALSVMSWILPFTFAIALAFIGQMKEWSIPLIFVNLFACYYLIGNFHAVHSTTLRSNGFKIIGWLGTAGFLIFLSFDEYWQKILDIDLVQRLVPNSFEFRYLIVFFLAALLMLMAQLRRFPWKEIGPMSGLFMVFNLIFFLGIITDFSQLLTNILILALSIVTIREGAKKDHLGILNSGLLLIGALVIARFFDTDIGFVTKGLLFVAVGIGFFVANSWIIKKRRNHG